MKRKWIKRIIGGLSFTSAMFIFQACYGTPQDYGYDILVEGQVKSQSSGLPIKGIKVSIADQIQYELTDKDGRFSMYTEQVKNLKIQFEDIDGKDNKEFLTRDTIVTIDEEQIFLDIKLEDK
ncbi:hypothetical protein EYV94_13515 [Puteibacter caeruleilacunae]|nr:hypothetical protein EYV94_13515 [Puteibacter caeruleilacunae]